MKMERVIFMAWLIWEGKWSDTNRNTRRFFLLLLFLDTIDLNSTHPTSPGLALGFIFPLFLVAGSMFHPVLCLKSAFVLSFP